VDVSTLADKHLFRGIDRVVLVSATIRRKTCHQLGIKDEDLDFREADSLWPVHRSPVIQVPAIRVNHKSTPLALKKWRTRIDQIIEGRCDRKGVIHTVSYARRDYLLDHSDYASIMITHDSSDTEKVIAKFRKLGPPAVLVSPSISTGYDLPGTDCEYIIIAKIPYPDGRGALAKARQDLDSDYTSYQAMQTLVQSCGRGLRYAQDRCEILVVDDNVIWFLSKYREFAPAWFRRKYRRAHQPPPPPPALDVDSESTTVL
jgi:Rad3-related DNA helicase